MTKEGSSIASCGEQKLIDACIKSDIAAVRNLLDQGVDVNCKFKKCSPLIQASLSGCFDLVKLLLERGADVSVKSRRGKTAKDYAETRGRADLVRLLDEYETIKIEKENGRLKTENEMLKEREGTMNEENLLKQELVDEYKARSKSLEEENQRAKDEIQRLRDEVSSLKDKEIRMNVENEFLKRRDEECRLERTAERAMFQRMISSFTNEFDDRKRKRNDAEENSMDRIV